MDAVKAMAMTPEQLNAGIKNIMDKKKAQSVNITRDFAIEKLEELDTTRKSYTKEDHDLDVYYTTLDGIQAMGISIEDIDLDVSKFQNSQPLTF